jgi:hypothetical protein
MPWEPWKQQLVDRHDRPVGRGWWVALGVIFVVGCGAAWLIGKLSGGGILGVALWLGISISLGWLMIALAIWLSLHFQPPAGMLSPPPWRSILIGWLKTLGYVLVPLVGILMIGEVWGREARFVSGLVLLLVSLYGPRVYRRLRRSA